MGHEDDRSAERHRLRSSRRCASGAPIPTDPLRVVTTVDLREVGEAIRQSASERATEIRDGITSRPEAILSLRSTLASTLGQLASETFSPLNPLGEGPPPEQGWAGVIAQGLSTGQAVMAFPGRLVDYTIATIGSAIVPPGMGLPAATALTVMHVGLPHGHLHPPSLVPPSPTPMPLPSMGTPLGPGCISVLIGGAPALRSGEVGVAPTCFSSTPGFDIITGSSSVFIGGARAARGGDLTRVCNPVGPMNILRTATAALSGLEAAATIATAAAHVTAAIADDNAAADAATSAAEAQAAAASATGNAVAAMMAVAQTAADMALMPIKSTIGVDVGVPPPAVGMLVGGQMNVQIGGLPVPPLGDLLNSRLHERLNRAGRRLRIALENRVRRATGHPEVGPCGRVGEPIDVTTGAVFSSTIDFSSGGLFRWVRHYASDRAHRPASLGRGFRHEYQRELRVRLHRCTYVDEQGVEYVFPRFERGQDAVRAHGFVLRRLGRGQYEVSRPGEPTLHFEGNEFTRRSRLVKLRRNELSLEIVSDVAGRAVAFIEIHAQTGQRRRFTLDRDAVGQITALREDGRAEPLARYGYDRAGCLVAARAGDLAEERFRYDEARRVVEHRRRDGYTFRWGYDAEGRCVVSSGEDGLFAVAITYERDKTRVRYADGGEWTWGIDADGIVTAVTDPCGGELLRVRAPQLGRVVREVDSAGRATELLLDDDGHHYARLDSFGSLLPPALAEPNAVSARAPKLPTSSLGWLLGGVLQPSAKAAVGISPRIIDLVPEHCHGDAEWVFQFGPEEDLGEVQEPREVLDSLERVTAFVDARGRQRRWIYGRNDVLAARIDRDGREWTYSVGRAWLIGRVRDPNGHETHYGWSETGRVVRVVDALGTEAHYERDAKDRITSFRLNGRVLESYVWGPGDVLLSKLDGNGERLVTYADHDRGLPQTIALASGETYRCAYDWLGRYTEASSSVDEVSLRRDAADRVLWDFRNGLGVEHRREASTVRTTVLERVEFSRRALSNGAVEITGPGGLWLLVEPRERGLVVRQFGSGSTELLQFDEEGNLLGRLAWAASRTWACRYARSAEGDLLEVADTTRGLTTYEVDPAHRLVGERVGTTARPIALDPVGNVLEKPGLVVAQVGWANQLVRANGVELRYDERGNLTERLRLDGSLVRYSYDSLDQLVRVEERSAGGELLGAPWIAAYDGLGRRVRCGRGDEQRELYWDGYRLAAEVAPNGRARAYVYPSDDALVPSAFVDLLAVDAPESARAFYVFADPVGTPLHIEDAHGRVVWWAERVDPYGAIDVAPSSEIEYRLRWPGHYYDPDLGLHYNRFRDYDPVLGRYLQLDPKGSAGGVNLYAYVANPLVSVDVLGLEDCRNQQRRSEEEQDEEGRPRTRTPGEPETGQEADRPRNPLAGLSEAELVAYCDHRKRELLEALSARPPAGDPEHAKRATYDVAVAQTGDDPETRRVIITNSDGSPKPHRAIRGLVADGEWSSAGPALRETVRVRDAGLPLIDPETGAPALDAQRQPRRVAAGDEPPDGYDRWEEVRNERGETVGYRPYRRSSSSDNHQSGESRHHAEQRARASTRPGERLVAMAPTKRMCGGCRRAMPEMIPHVPEDMRGSD